MVSIQSILSADLAVSKHVRILVVETFEPFFVFLPDSIDLSLLFLFCPMTVVACWTSGTSWEIATDITLMETIGNPNAARWGTRLVHIRTYLENNVCNDSRSVGTCHKLNSFWTNAVLLGTNLRGTFDLLLVSFRSLFVFPLLSKRSGNRLTVRHKSEKCNVDSFCFNLFSFRRSMVFS